MLLPLLKTCGLSQKYERILISVHFQDKLVSERIPAIMQSGSVIPLTLRRGQFGLICLCQASGSINGLSIHPKPISYIQRNFPYPGTPPRDASELQSLHRYLRYHPLQVIHYRAMIEIQYFSILRSGGPTLHLPIKCQVDICKQGPTSTAFQFRDSLLGHSVNPS